MREVPRITLFERAGCHLCEEASVLLDDVIGRNRYERIDIDTDDELLLHYGHRIPVVAVDGVDRRELIITRPDLAAVLER